MLLSQIYWLVYAMIMFISIYLCCSYHYYCSITHYHDASMVIPFISFTIRMTHSTNIISKDEVIQATSEDLLFYCR